MQRLDRFSSRVTLYVSCGGGTSPQRYNGPGKALHELPVRLSKAVRARAFNIDCADDTAVQAHWNYEFSLRAAEGSQVAGVSRDIIHDDRLACCNSRPI
jgi:hypothetical protein